MDKMSFELWNEVDKKLIVKLEYKYDNETSQYVEVKFPGCFKIGAAFRHFSEVFICFCFFSRLLGWEGKLDNSKKIWPILV